LCPDKIFEENEKKKINACSFMHFDSTL